jgi:hypothetical protein
MSFRILPLPAADADRLRRDATIVRLADESPGFPCRACLCDAAIGDELVLVSYDPFAGWDAATTSPYHSAGPVYLHRRDCSSDLDAAPLPAQLTSRRLSVRAYDAAAMMLDGRVVHGSELSTALDELSTLPGVDRIHVHNAGAGCFAAAVDLVTA